MNPAELLLQIMAKISEYRHYSKKRYGCYSLPLQYYLDKAEIAVSTFQNAKVKINRGKPISRGDLDKFRRLQTVVEHEVERLLKEQKAEKEAQEQKKRDAVKVGITAVDFNLIMAFAACKDAIQLRGI